MENEITESLNPKQRLFLTLLLEGNKVVDAYRKAGYEGETPAAYVLKSRLEKELQLMAEARGCSKGDLMLEISNLNVLPVVDKYGKPVEGISMAHKLKLLELQKKTLEMNKQEAPKVTAFQINNYVGDAKKSEVIETSTVLPETKGEDQTAG